MRKLFSCLKEVIIIFGLALILALVLKTFVLDNRVIPTPSMVPTVPVDSRILVNRMVYWFGEPKLGDIVVFEPTPETQMEVGLTDDMLKRVIGVPGDIVQVKEKTLYINEKPQDEPYIAEAMNYDFGPLEVPEGMVFVLGDNRNSSFDSHAWSNPFVPEKSVKGKAFLIYWPKAAWGFLK